MLISISEYAALHKKSPVTIRQRVQRGTLPAVKIGRNWVIDSETPLTDSRVRAGSYKNWRNKPDLDPAD